MEPLTFGFAEKVCCIAVSAWLGWRKGAGKPALLFVEPPPRRRHVLAAENQGRRVCSSEGGVPAGECFRLLYPEDDPRESEPC